MLRVIFLAFTAALTTVAAQADQVSYLLCEYESLGEDESRAVQSIPLYYERGELVAIGRRNHCVDEPDYRITDTHAAWRCTTARDVNQAPVRSVYVQINRFSGRYHRNDFDGDYNDLSIRKVWHGVCTAHHEAQF